VRPGTIRAVIVSGAVEIRPMMHARFQDYGLADPLERAGIAAAADDRVGTRR